VSRKILEGIRIVEFGWAVVGPLTTSWAGNYGAQVIKVESETRPDIIRSMTPFVGDRVDTNNSLFFGRENASKFSIALNLKHPEGVNLAKRLIAKSDVVVESYTAGVMDRYGLGYDELKKIRPDIIMLSSCMYGQTGALRAMPGYGVPLTAISGLTYLCGWPDRAPAGPYGSYTDYLVPRLNLLALASALDYRRRTGRGTHIDAAQLECSVQFVAPVLLEYTANKRVASRSGNASDRAAPHGVFRCKGNDRWCAITVFTDEEWRGLCEAMVKPPWTNEPEFQTLSERKKNENALNGRIEAWTVEHEAEEIMSLLQSHGVSAGVANDGRDLAKDPQLNHDHYYRRLHHPEMGAVDFVPHSIEFSKAEQEIFRSPCLGEHTEYVCREIIGLSGDEFDALLDQGVFE
jgi:benzylsuccinate CoA-transferase BbsF subunit